MGADIHSAAYVQANGGWNQVTERLWTNYKFSPNRLQTSDNLLSTNQPFTARVPEVFSALSGVGSVQNKLLNPLIHQRRGAFSGLQALCESGTDPVDLTHASWASFEELLTYSNNSRSTVLKLHLTAALRPLLKYQGAGHGTLISWAFDNA